MYQIDVSTVSTAQPASTALGTTGYFTDGNAATGVAATIVPAEFLNSVMLELMNTITGAGLSLSKSSFNQLYTAIKTIALSSPALTGSPTAPTAAQFDADTSVATTAFVQRALGNYQSRQYLTGATTLTISESGAWVQCGGTGPYTVTLPAPTTINTVLTISHVATGTVTLSTPSASIYNQGAAAATLAMVNSDTVKLASDGSNWNVLEYYTKSPNFVGTPTGTTPALYDSSTKLATTAYVQANTLSLGAVIGASVDLNTITTAGVYIQSTNANATTGTNYPVAQAGMLEVYQSPSNTSFTFQRYTVYTTTYPTVYVRTYYNSAWGSWQQLAFTASPAFSGTPTSTTPAQFDNTTKLATTAFVKQAGFNYPTSGIGIGSSVTLTIAQLNGWGQFQSSGLTATLPALASATLGSTFTFLGGSTGGTVKGNASETIQSASATNANTLTVAAGEIVTVVANGSSSSWFVVNDAVSANSPAFAGTPTAPTPALFDNSTKLATTAFVQTALGSLSGFSYYTTSSTLTASQAGQEVQIGAAGITLTLPVGSGIKLGSLYRFSATQASTIATQGSDFMYVAGGTGNVTSIALQAGDTLLLMSRGNTEWDIIGGTGMVQFMSPLAKTPAQFDSTTKLATTAFVNRALGSMAGYESHNASITLPATSAGYCVMLYGTTASQVCTLPLLSSVSTGSTYWVMNGGSVPWTVSVNSTSTETFTSLAPGGVTSPTTITLGVGDSIAFVASSSNYIWRAFGTTSAKLFTSPALTGTPTAPTATAGTSSTQLATTAFVSTAVSAVSSGYQTALGYTPVQQGGPSNQGTNKVYIGWDTGAAGVRCTVDTTDLGFFWSDSKGALSAAANGYTKLPNGLYIMWGTTAAFNSTANTYMSGSFNFPLAFPSACLNVSLTVNSGAVVAANTPWCSAKSTTGASFYIGNPNNGTSSASITLSFIAIGY